MRQILERIVADRVVLALIAINTVVIFLRGFRGLDGHEHWLYTVDYAITLFFVFELIVKLSLRGFAGYWRVSWNRLDLLVVLASAPMLLSPWLDFQSMGVVLVVRSARLLRLLRAFRMIPESERLWEGVRRALRASVGVFLVMLVYNVILGLGAHTLFGSIAPKYFDNPALSMYSVFKIFTVEGWFDIPDYIAEHASTEMALVARFYFTFAVVTGGILGLSLANAVFVDEMVIDNTNHVEEHVDQLAKGLEENQQRSEAAIEELTQQIEALRTESRPGQDRGGESAGRRGV